MRHASAQQDSQNRHGRPSRCVSVCRLYEALQDLHQMLTCPPIPANPFPRLTSLFLEYGCRLDHWESQPVTFHLQKYARTTCTFGMVLKMHAQHQTITYIVLHAHYHMHGTVCTVPHESHAKPYSAFSAGNSSDITTYGTVSGDLATTQLVPFLFLQLHTHSTGHCLALNPAETLQGFSLSPLLCQMHERRSMSVIQKLYIMLQPRWQLFFTCRELQACFGMR